MQEMRKANLEKTMPSPEIWEQVWATLEEISDESGEENLGKGYLLKYEGWGGICVEEIWTKVEAEQRRRGIHSGSEEIEEEREQACYEFAEEQSYKIIDEEWKPELKERGYCFITGGYDHGGLYGRTWALFKKHS
jgi:hypothetical protein